MYKGVPIFLFIFLLFNNYKKIFKIFNSEISKLNILKIKSYLNITNYGVK
jgi:hypothetical protein